MFSSIDLPTIFSPLSDAVVILAILLLVFFVSRAIISGLARQEFREVPLFWRLSVMSGLILGTMAFLSAILGDGPQLGTLFVVDGAWDLTLSSFLLYRVGPGETYFSGLYAVLASGGSWFNAGAVMIVVSMVAIVVAALKVGSGHLSHSFRIILASLISLFTTAWLLVYGLSALLWAIHMLNFWVLFLVILILRWPFVSLSWLKPNSSASQGVARRR